ncbi:MAG: Trp family transcriptional regulator [Candidatus Berkelbacteria bacterium]|nr:Trp family transcriptional regulator [Candidatus Berkelbacteria bacterium]
MVKTNIDLKAKKEFFEALKKVGKEDFEGFFKDLMSSAEIKDLSRRFLASKLLKRGKTYQEIRDLMGMSEGTINKVYFKTKGSRILPHLF